MVNVLKIIRVIRVVLVKYKLSTIKINNDKVSKREILIGIRLGRRLAYNNPSSGSGWLIFALVVTARILIIMFCKKNRQRWITVCFCVCTLVFNIWSIKEVELLNGVYNFVMKVVSLDNIMNEIYLAYEKGKYKGLELLTWDEIEKKRKKKIIRSSKKYRQFRIKCVLTRNVFFALYKSAKFYARNHDLGQNNNDGNIFEAPRKPHVVNIVEFGAKKDSNIPNQFVPITSEELGVFEGESHYRRGRLAIMNEQHLEEEGLRRNIRLIV
jgi:hypothetical protein